MPSDRRRRYRADGTLQRHGNVLIGGSPLRLFRVTAAGRAVVEQIVAGDDVAGSALTDSLEDAGAIHPTPTAGAPFRADEVTIVTPTLGEPLHVAPNAVLVDDGSAIPVGGAALRHDTTRGPAAARNTGLGHVTTPLVAFVDADVVVPEGWLEPLLAHFVDDRVALVAPRVAARPGPTMLARYESSSSPIDLGAEPARIRAGTRVGYVPAAAIVCRTDAVRAIGGFDESLRYGEDVDLVWRLDEAGWRCRYEPTSVVHHEPRRSWPDWIRQRVSYGSSAAPLAERHPASLAPLRVNAWSLIAWSLGAIGRPGVGALVGAGSAAALVPRLPDVPPLAALRLAAVGNLRAGEQIAHAIRRAWWPVLAIAGLRSRAARRLLIAALVAQPHPLRALDDVAYSIGVWKGVIATRSATALMPAISSWPPRRASSASPPADAH
ncbi:MAG: mycofactocin biosynthesis glycosyltransferase MftF [Ilumatobacter sp.]|uniref:mycofactocin biosynthesis glycosyltransferase MftF n=1 Tax=Ilumatobacter sp. TaxID=1967498 RepID=UPI002633B7DD|nr:mycofactocin biosynthesis glycosyltransferase MftF [Ilumatobacter sp.]MDJ0770382.1 mycofactocin biosynthesis glycosyltransferase MftF [Ilumatobacter sp.]